MLSGCHSLLAGSSWLLMTLRSLGQIFVLLHLEVVYGLCLPLLCSVSENEEPFLHAKAKASTLALDLIPFKKLACHSLPCPGFRVHVHVSSSGPCSSHLAELHKSILPCLLPSCVSPPTRILHINGTLILLMVMFFPHSKTLSVSPCLPCQGPTLDLHTGPFAICPHFPYMGGKFNPLFPPFSHQIQLIKISCRLYSALTLLVPPPFPQPLCFCLAPTLFISYLNSYKNLVPGFPTSSSSLSVMLFMLHIAGFSKRKYDYCILP